MAINISLVKYESKDGVFCEDNLKNYEVTVIPDEIYSFIQDERLIEEKEVLEEDSNERFNIEILIESKIDKILNKLKEIVKSKCKDINSDLLSNQDEDNILNNLKQLLNFRAICLDKIETYNKNDNIFLQIG